MQLSKLLTLSVKTSRKDRSFVNHSEVLLVFCFIMEFLLTLVRHEVRSVFSIHVGSGVGEERSRNMPISVFHILAEIKPVILEYFISNPKVLQSKPAHRMLDPWEKCSSI